ncbi:MAG: hypothetical protein QOC62_6073 [Mycobacterium sp.]|jgi:hypothetical protein|nr:hypothetical protein [Mycobacterium sp.]
MSRTGTSTPEATKAAAATPSRVFSLRRASDRFPGGGVPNLRAASATDQALLDHYCAEIGRNPASLTRSVYLSVSYDRPDVTRDAIGRAIDAGFQHLVLGLPNPYPVGVAQWVVDELITKAA